jgi:hypothetical protein
MRRTRTPCPADSRISPDAPRLCIRSPRSEVEKNRGIRNPGPCVVVFPPALATKRHSKACSPLLNLYTVSLLDLVRVSVPRAFKVHGPPASETQTTALY